MGSAVSFLLAMFLLVILFRESSQAFNGLLCTDGKKCARRRMGGLAKVCLAIFVVFHHPLFLIAGKYLVGLNSLSLLEKTWKKIRVYLSCLARNE